MTTICCYKGHLAADSRYTADGEMLTDETVKIVADRADGLITTGAGEGGPLEIFTRSLWDDIAWLPGGGPIFDEDSVEFYKDIYGWVYRPGDTYLYQSSKRGFDPLPINGDLPQAIGSGAPYVKGAIAAMAPHRKALKLTYRQLLIAAMEAAIKCDTYSGGKIVVVKLT